MLFGVDTIKICITLPTHGCVVFHETPFMTPLPQMTSTDKDFRFMATNDLMTELQKDSIKLDDDSERKVVRMLLKLLEDKNGEVQNLAVRCLGPLVGKVKDFQVGFNCMDLCVTFLPHTQFHRNRLL